MLDLPATIAAFTALLVAVGAFVLNFLKDRASEKALAAASLAAANATAARAAAEASDAKLVEIDGKIFNLGKAVDGRLTALIASLEENANIRVDAAKLAGHAEGRADEKAEAEGRVDQAANGGRRRQDPPG